MRLQKTSQGKLQIFDLIRKKYVAFTPEEEVRQSLIDYLHKQSAIPLSCMAAEKSFSMYGKQHRPDLIVCNKQTTPVLLAECKAPHIPISLLTHEQISRYQLIHKVPYWILTNGKECHCYKIDLQSGEIQILNHIPDWKELNEL